MCPGAHTTASPASTLGLAEALTIPEPEQAYLCSGYSRCAGMGVFPQIICGFGLFLSNCNSFPFRMLRFEKCWGKVWVIPVACPAVCLNPAEVNIRDTLHE